MISELVLPSSDKPNKLFCAVTIVFSVFINGLKKLNVSLDRKILADLAMNEPNSFKHIAEQVQSSVK